MEQLSSIVNEEIAKLLKEKGFEQTLEVGVICRLTNSVNKDYEITREIKKSDIDNLWCIFNETYPNIATVIDWIYNKHNIWINVSPVFEYNDEKEDYLILQGFQYYITTIVDNKNDVSIADKEIKNSLKEAYIEAIRHTLLNLI